MDIEVCRHFYDVPGARLPIVGEVHVVLVVEQAEADLVSGEGPWPELHDAGLLIEGEVCHVDCARGLKTKNMSCNIFDETQQLTVDRKRCFILNVFITSSWLQASIKCNNAPGPRTISHQPLIWLFKPNIFQRNSTHHNAEVANFDLEFLFI